MNLYPNVYVNNVKEINMEILDKFQIKGLVLDIDNTLIDYDKKLLDGAKEWCENLKENGIKMCILSNTNKHYKVKNVANVLNLKYEYFAHKPSKKGFKKAIAMLELKPENIAAVGDQIFTDVWGGNRCNMKTILTKPIDKRDIFITRLKRPFEKIIINKYVKKEENNR